MKHVSFPCVISLLVLLGTTTSCVKESAASGTAGTRLALAKPADQRMAQGDSNRVAIAVERTGFGDAVRVTFSNLPEGVKVDADTIIAGDSKRDFVLVAAPTAAIVELQIVTVKAVGSSITTSQTFELSVKAKS